MTTLFSDHLTSGEPIEVWVELTGETFDTNGMVDGIDNVGLADWRVAKSPPEISRAE
ncbi:hypothetical protein BH23CHL5_BH23CHL5_16350 [soil metagenome]